MEIINYPHSKGAILQDPYRVVVHAMAEYLYHEGKWRHASEFLEMIGLSVHGLACPNGDIIKCREIYQGAYHAKGNNVDTIGWEWLVEGEHDYESFVIAIQKPYLTDIQYANGCNYIRKEYVQSAGILNYVKHSDIDPKGKKPDPGDGFLFDDFLRKIGVVI